MNTSLTVFGCLNFLIPIIILNPVLFLHDIYAGVTYSLPCLEGGDGNERYVQPRIDLHRSEVLCCVYSTLLASTQLVALLYFDLWGKGRMSEEGQELKVVCLYAREPGRAS